MIIKECENKDQKLRQRQRDRRTAELKYQIDSGSDSAQMDKKKQAGKVQDVRSTFQ